MSVSRTDVQALTVLASYVRDEALVRGFDRDVTPKDLLFLWDALMEARLGLDADIVIAGARQ